MGFAGHVYDEQLYVIKIVSRISMSSVKQMEKKPAENVGA